MSVISNSNVGGSEACVYVMVYPGCIPPPHLSLPEHTTLTYITPPTPRSVTELCWSLTSRSLQLFITVSYWCCSPQRYREDKTLSELDLPSQLMSCDEISELGAAWIQTIRAKEKMEYLLQSEQLLIFSPWAAHICHSLAVFPEELQPLKQSK